MMSIRGLAVLLCCAVLAGCAPLAPITLATFDGATGTTHNWAAVSDPVMGGQSYANFSESAKLGEWQGEVKIVPFLHAPGFCNLQAPGLGQKDSFPDCSGTAGLVIKGRAVSGSLTHYNAMLITRGAKRLFKQATYLANYTLGSEMDEVRLPWSKFACSWRGQPVSWCPSLESQLGQISNIGVGTAFPGAAGKFHVELESISAQ